MPSWSAAPLRVRNKDELSPLRGRNAELGAKSFREVRVIEEAEFLCNRRDIAIGRDTAERRAQSQSAHVEA
jgi:hypothetical protein